MHIWLEYLKQQGARTASPESMEIEGFGETEVHPEAESDFIAPLTELGLISASGEDAASFLHSQLTNDVERLAATQVRLAGYCSPKGRLLATMLLWKSGNDILLQLPRQIQPAIQKRLQMFVLRAKVKLMDVSNSHVVLGLGGKAAHDALLSYFPALPSQPYGKADSDAGTLIRLPDADGHPRFQWVTSLETAQSAWLELTRTLRPVGAARWRLGEIRAGIPHIVQATQEQFVPQMINFEVVGGVSFKKGCYPGQEIVARTQYLGKLKRRMQRATVSTANAQPGMEIFSSSDPDQPCGMIVNAESTGINTSECLVELKTAAQESGSLHLGSANGPVLVLQDLPYVLTDITQNA